MRIEALQVQNDRAERDDDEDQPLKLREWRNLFIEGEPRISDEPQGMRAPERDDHQQTIDDLLDLAVEFFFAVEHEFGCERYGTGARCDSRETRHQCQQKPERFTENF